MDYLNFDVITHTEIIEEIPMKFPAIIFCIKRYTKNKNVRLKEIIDKCEFQFNSCDLDEDFEFFLSRINNFDRCMRFNGYKNNSIKYETD